LTLSFSKQTVPPVPLTSSQSMAQPEVMIEHQLMTRTEPMLSFEEATSSVTGAGEACKEKMDAACPAYWYNHIAVWFLIKVYVVGNAMEDTYSGATYLSVDGMGSRCTLPAL